MTEREFGSLWKPFDAYLRGLPVNGGDLVETELPDDLQNYVEFLFYAYVDIPTDAEQTKREFVFKSTLSSGLYEGTHTRRLRASGAGYSPSETFSLPQPYNQRIRIVRTGSEIKTVENSIESGIVLIGAR